MATGRTNSVRGYAYTNAFKARGWELRGEATLPALPTHFDVCIIIKLLCREA